MNCATKMKVKLVMKTSYELRHSATREPVLSSSPSWSFLPLRMDLLVLFFILAMIINTDINTVTNMQSVTYREFPVPGIVHFFGGIGTGIGKNWYRKKVSEPVSEKIGTGKRSRNRYRKNLVPEKVSELKPLFLLPKFRNL